VTLATLAHARQDYSYAFLDEFAKRELRRRMLKAIAIPGYQVPYASRELPIARGWGTGGLQITLSLVGPRDTIKVIDQGADDSVNAANLRRFIARVAGAATTTDTLEATIIQSRHRFPEERLLELYEQLVRHKTFTGGADYPVMVHGRYLMAPSPIPRWDTPMLHQAAHLTLLSAGREKRLYAVPPYTDVRPIEFDDVPFRVESQDGRICALTGAQHKFMNEIPLPDGSSRFVLSDTSYAAKLLQRARDEKVELGATYYDDAGAFYHPGYLRPPRDGDLLDEGQAQEGV
jgi:alpha-D-ribose 1-methylphosphonate 5-phosphate C-P lyase